MAATEPEPASFVTTFPSSTSTSSKPPKEPSPQPIPSPYDASAAPDDNDDIFAPLLSLESTLYTEGHTLGLADGRALTRHESHIFGIETAFTRFAEMARLSAKCRIWTSRLRSSRVERHQQDGHGATQEVEEAEGEGRRDQANTERLRKHLSVLEGLVDLSTVECTNSDEAVGAFDERLRRARAKVVVVERLLGVGTYSAEGGKLKHEQKGEEKGGGGMERDMAFVGRNGRENIEDFGG